MWVSLLLALASIVPWPVHGGQEEDRTALLIIDVQDCFLPPSGSLAVTDGGEVIPVINKIRQDFKQDIALVVLSQDWHCADHVSFASQHVGLQPYDLVNLTYNDQGGLCRQDSFVSSFQHAVYCTSQDNENASIVTQTLWPDHCIKNVTSGPTSSGFSTALSMMESDILIKKGFHCDVDSYSAFFDNGGFRQTQLHDVLEQHHIKRVIVTGLALDYCVYYTSMDAHRLGYKVITVTDAARAVAPGTRSAALSDMEASGIQLITSDKLRATLDASSNKAGTPWERGVVILLVLTNIFHIC